MSKKQDILTIISIGVLAFSALVSAYQAWETRYHDGLMIKPLLSFYYQPDETDKNVGLILENVGLGPAIIKSFSIYIDNQPIQDWEHVAAACKIKKDIDEITWNIFEKDEPLKVGEPIFVYSRPTNKVEGLDEFVNCMYDRMKILVTYCSIDKECQTSCSPDSLCK